jgi:uncharacterized protein (TIGR03083 family)
VQISPRYDGEPIIELDGAVDDVHAPFVRQRRRLLATLSSLDDAQWKTASRCEGWTVHDVVNHLIVTDGFWLRSMEAGLTGTPSRFLVGFDPKETPAQLAEGMRAQSTVDSLAQLRDAVGALLDLVGGLDDAGWQTIAEAPPGHLPIRLLAHHALWDSWVHERDIVLPVGIAPTEEDDEIRCGLRYAAALGPGFALSTTPDARGRLVLEVADAEPVVIDVDGIVRVRDGGDVPAEAVVLRGTATQLLESVSVREPLDAEIEPDRRWLVAGLAEVFEVGTA